MMSEIIVALDFSNEQAVVEFLKEFDQPIYTKVGMELFYTYGPKIIDTIQTMGHKIFLDLKLHDIPNTVQSAMKNLAQLEVDMVNVHVAGGSRMMQAAIEGLESGTATGKKRPLCIGVTQLTSTSEKMMQQELLIVNSLDEVVVEYAKLANRSGLDGVVCSVHESKAIHTHCGNEFLTVTPGIRLANDSVDDQVRIATPTYAKEQGSNLLVVGRSITQSENPFETYATIQDMLK
ncbi:MAG: orotidine-5'-phosphate decarboxylase [Culicoidibacterales bacterium]